MTANTTTVYFSGSGTGLMFGPAMMPLCECGKGLATQQVTFTDGTPSRRVCPACVERLKRESAIKHAPAWIEAAFTAIRPRAARAALPPARGRVPS